jgi:hypothetical protein
MGFNVLQADEYIATSGIVARVDNVFPKAQSIPEAHPTPTIWQPWIGTGLGPFVCV